MNSFLTNKNVFIGSAILLILFISFVYYCYKTNSSEAKGREELLKNYKKAFDLLKGSTKKLYPDAIFDEIVKKYDEFMKKSKSEHFDASAVYKNLVSSSDLSTKYDTTLKKALAGSKDTVMTAYAKSTIELTEKLAKDTADAKAIKDAVDAKLAKDTADAKLAKDTADAKLAKATADAKLAKDAADAKLAKDTADAKALKNAADAKLAKDTADAKALKDAADAKKAKDAVDAANADDITNGDVKIETYLKANYNPLDQMIGMMLYQTSVIQAFRKQTERQAEIVKFLKFLQDNQYNNFAVAVAVKK